MPTNDGPAVPRGRIRRTMPLAGFTAELLGQSKGVLMKAGQILSIVDADWIEDSEFSRYQASLSQLQADAPPMDTTLARQVLQG